MSGRDVTLQKQNTNKPNTVLYMFVHVMCVSGQDPDPKKLKEMIKESDAQLNFTHFLNMFGARLGGQ